MNTNEIEKRGRSLQASLGKAVKQIDRKSPRDLDAQFQDAHLEAFSSIDCMDCANCCKTTGPRLSEVDCERLAAHLKISVKVFHERYVRTDEDGDYVMKVLPCPFLAGDNSCTVYAHRPKACRTYPHTDRRRQKQLLNLHIKNLEVCPAVQQILEKITKSYPYS